MCLLLAHCLLYEVVVYLVLLSVCGLCVSDDGRWKNLKMEGKLNYSGKKNPVIVSFYCLQVSRGINCAKPMSLY